MSYHDVGLSSSMDGSMVLSRDWRKSWPIWAALEVSHKQVGFKVWTTRAVPKSKDGFIEEGFSRKNEIKNVIELGRDIRWVPFLPRSGPGAGGIENAGFFIQPKIFATF